MQKKSTFWAWAPVIGWLAILLVESSDLGSSERTASLLWKMWTTLLGTPDRGTFDLVHHVLRKTGHFTGYGILSLLIFRAVRLVWRNRHMIMARGREYYWQLRWAAVAMIGTLLAASADEIHQGFNPHRTSRWQDVVIDCSGALALQIILFLYLSIDKNGRGRTAATAAS